MINSFVNVFEIGKRYKCPAADHNGTAVFTVVSRTACTVTLENGGTVKRYTISKAAGACSFSEAVFPFGRSVPSVLTAHQVVFEDKPQTVKKTLTCENIRELIFEAVKDYDPGKAYTFARGMRAAFEAVGFETGEALYDALEDRDNRAAKGGGGHALMVCTGCPFCPCPCCLGGCECSVLVRDRKRGIITGHGLYK